MPLDIIFMVLAFILLIGSKYWKNLFTYIGGHDLELDGIQTQRDKSGLLKERMPKNSEKINKQTTLYNPKRPQRKIDSYKNHKMIKKQLNIEE